MVHLNPKLTLNLGLPLIELTIQAHAGWFKVDAQAAIPLGSAEVRLRIPAGSQPIKTRASQLRPPRGMICSALPAIDLPRPDLAHNWHTLSASTRVDGTAK